ncbi:peptidase domain-containing ABC transporter [Kineococcus sp. SYSU DK002]|uniref:peptidase domain-containing ABC transporter n=1 Tax=Kineococcus sp. SYSU DK002 TaxID=3383123 RepID=UPI003D7EBB26
MRRTPVVLQTTPTECGAACLTMVLRHHGRATSLTELTALLQPGRDGLSALALVQAARASGLETRAVRVAPEDLGDLPGPVVVHLRHGHFVVLEGAGAHGADVVDPGGGRQRWTPAELAERFSGVALVLRPGPGFERRRRRPDAPLRRRVLSTLLLRRRGLLAQVLLASLLLQLTALVIPVSTEALVDRVLPHAGTTPAAAVDLLHLLGAAVLLAVVAQALTGYLRAVLLVRLRARSDADLTGGLVAHLLSLPHSWFTRRGTSDVLSRVGGVSVVRDGVTGQVLAALLDAPLALGYVVLILVRDPVVGGVLAGLTVAQVVLLLASTGRIAALTRRELAADAESQSHLMQAVSGIETLKAAGAEARALRRWSASFSARLRADTEAGLAQGALDAVLTALRFAAPLALLWVGAWRLLGGHLGLGELLALSSLAGAALVPLSSVMTSLQQLQSAAAHLDRLVDVLAAEPEPVGGLRVQRLRGAVSLRGVSFRHDPRGPWVLQDVDLDVAPGQKIAVVGPSGAGKSTLARLLLGLHEPTSGEVRYDGVPAHHYERTALRQHFGVVVQSPALFTGTIADNIRLSDPDASFERVVAAARTACLHDDVEGMPMRYDTLLVDGGGLSGGQRQRLALARALLGEPRLLLLDESTSHLDPGTEARIEENLARLPITRIVIAHRLSTVRDADLVVVVDDGRVVERGRPEDLLAAGGHYAGMVAAHARGTAEPWAADARP